MRKEDKKILKKLKETKLAITICTHEQYADVQGIHLNQPDLWYLRNAIQDSAKDGFKTIFAHYKTVGLNYKIPSEVLNELVEIAKRKGMLVSFTHPASIYNKK